MGNGFVFASSYNQAIEIYYFNTYTISLSHIELPLYITNCIILLHLYLLINITTTYFSAL